jgi:NAD(P)-dependent dehydrogenase (short-subunit alcohol dehydrogenase family)
MTEVRLEGKVAIVTGAGSGIGRESALLFAKEGAKVVVADIDERRGPETVGEIRSSGGDAFFAKVDTTDAKSIVTMVESTVERYGGIDVLLNNVGLFGISGTIVELKEEDWDFMIKINLKSPFLVSKYVIPEMLKRGKGSIVNIASEVGVVGAPGESAYSSAKGGVVQLTKCMALDYATKNLRVNAIAPCNIETPMFSNWLKGVGNPDEVRKEILRLMPMRRFGRPVEIANVALFLASDESSYITGATILADSGFTAQ